MYPCSKQDAKTHAKNATPEHRTKTHKNSKNTRQETRRAGNMGVEDIIRVIEKNGIKITKYRSNDPCSLDKEEVLDLTLLDGAIVETKIYADIVRKERRSFVEIKEDREIGNGYRRVERWYLGFVGKCLVFTIETTVDAVREYGEYYETYVLPLAKLIDGRKITKKIGGGCGPDYEPAEEIEVQQIV